MHIEINEINIFDEDGAKVGTVTESNGSAMVRINTLVDETNMQKLWESLEKAIALINDDGKVEEPEIEEN